MAADLNMATSPERTDESVVEEIARSDGEIALAHLRSFVTSWNAL